MQRISQDLSKMEQLQLPNDIPVLDDYNQLTQDEEDGDISSALSMTSTCYNFRRENGRLYQDYRSPHPFPHDNEAELNELWLHSLVEIILNNQLFAAPVVPQQLRNVLDLGSGRGFWAEQVADQYPDCHVTAIDKVPHERSTFPNCEFMVFDIAQDWIFNQPDLKFDFIHIRSLFASLPQSDWPMLYQQCLSHLEPGGWVEQTEVEIIAHCDDETQNPNSEVAKLASLSEAMGEAYGTDFRIAERMDQEMKAAGFVDVTQKKAKLPLGHWSADPTYREIGTLFEQYYRTGLEGWMMHVMTRSMGWTGDQVTQAAERAFKEIASRKHHYYFYLVIAAGRKP